MVAGNATQDQEKKVKSIFSHIYPPHTALAALLEPAARLIFYTAAH